MPIYVKVANFPGLYRHARSGRYSACKKQGGIRRERSLQTSDRKIAERRMKEWLGSLEKVDAEVEKTTLGQLIECYRVATDSISGGSCAVFSALTADASPIAPGPRFFAKSCADQVNFRAALQAELPS